MSLISINEALGERGQRSEVEDRPCTDFALSSAAEALADLPVDESADEISEARLYLSAMTYFFSCRE